MRQTSRRERGLTERLRRRDSALLTEGRLPRITPAKMPERFC